MLKIGDKVRYSNDFIAKHNFIAPGQKRSGRKSKWFNRRRGENKVMTVLDIQRGQWDWKNKRYTGDIVMVDDMVEGYKPGTYHYRMLNTHWLRFVRRDT